MRQSRLMSLVEAIANVAVGYGVAVVTQLAVFPWFGLPSRISDAVAIGAIFTVVSILRSYALRRLFEAIRTRTLIADSGNAINEVRNRVLTVFHHDPNQDESV